MANKSAKKAAKKKAAKRHNNTPIGSADEMENSVDLPADLNPRHRLFVLEYLKDWNATRAYMATYPESSRESALANSARLIGNDRIKEIITLEANRILDGRRDRLKTLVTESLDQDLSSEIGDYVTKGSIDFRKLTESNPRSVAAITIETQKDDRGTKKKVQLKLNDRARAREHAMKLLGLLSDDSGKVIVINMPQGYDEV